MSNYQPSQNKCSSASVRNATLAIHQVLQEAGYAGDYVFDGRVARDIYGDPDGQPCSVEILFLKQIHALSLKQVIPTLDPHSFWYMRAGERLEWRSPDNDQSVEIILLPPFSTYASSEILTIDDLPVPPYPHLILSCLWRWAQSRQEGAQAFPSLVSPGRWIRETEQTEIERQKDELSKDILSMHIFLLSGSEFISINPAKPFDKYLRDACQLVVEGFCTEYPTTRNVWGKLGIKMEAGGSKLAQPRAPPGSTSTQRRGRSTAGTDRHGNDGSASSTSSPSGATTNNTRRSSKASTSTIALQYDQKSKLSKYDIRYQASQTTIEILEKLGYRCALFGSMACKLYGNGRIPEDVDVLVIPPESLRSINDPELASGPMFMTEHEALKTQEHIKSLLVAHCSPESHYVLVKSKRPNATHKVLYWIPDPPNDNRQEMPDDNDDGLAAAIGGLNINGNKGAKATTKNSAKRHQTSTHPPRFNSTKVDIFVPPSFSLPLLPPSLRSFRGNLPCVPYPLLLAQKLKGWADHKERLQGSRNGTDVNKEEEDGTENRRKPANGESRGLTKVSQDVSDLKWLIGGLGTYGGDGRGGGGRSRYWPYWERVYQVQGRLDRGGDVSQYWHWDGAEHVEPGGNAGGRVWKDRRMFSREFEEQTRQRVQMICEDFPEMLEGWLALGF